MTPAGPAPRPHPRRELTEVSLEPDPVAQFRQWFHDAVASGVTEPNAVVLATASGEGRPGVRTVLLKAFDERGFVFFTNYGSRKARDLEANPHGALLLPWHPLERQVIVEGPVSRVSREESEAYFGSRPRASQLAAWASAQSSALGSRADLEDRYDTCATRWPEDVAVPTPDFWGGYRVAHESVEFWQGRAHRLHDRLRYVRDGEGWRVERLSP